MGVNEGRSSDQRKPVAAFNSGPQTASILKVNEIS